MILKITGLYKMCCCLLLLVAIFASCKRSGRRMPDMAPPYMYRDKEPMGTNIAFRLLPGQFTEGVSLASKKMKGFGTGFNYLKSTVYISIGKNLVLDSTALDELLHYVDSGNEFFIADEHIDYRLLDTLGVRQENAFMESFGMQRKKNTAVQLSDTQTFGTTAYGFFYYPLAGQFNAYDSSTTKLLGTNEKGAPNFIVTRYGKGKIYFHAAPAAFSNYFLLTANNTTYFKQVFSYLNEDAYSVFWADTSQFGNKPADFSAFAIFWKNPALKYALLIACTLMLLYIAFGSKRKRRLVPARLPNTNDSLSFVHTIGNLYLQKKDNRNIAVKMMTYFLEYVRNTYLLSTQTLNAEFVQSLSRKSGVEEKKVQDLVTNAAHLNEAESISDQELFDINNLIHEFYKK